MRKSDTVQTEGSWTSAGNENRLPRTAGPRQNRDGAHLAQRGASPLFRRGTLLRPGATAERETEMRLTFVVRARAAARAPGFTALAAVLNIRRGWKETRRIGSFPPSTCGVKSRFPPPLVG
jgi:hypothetical protein